VAADSERGFRSNYNDVYLTNGAKFGQWQGNSVNTWADWTFATNADRYSRTNNPLFVDADGPDNLLGFTGGVDHGTDDNFLVQAGSPTIDAGDPASLYAGEPSPSGGRVNIGHTGNTAQAALGVSGPTVWMISPNGFEKFETGQNYTVTYRSAGLQAWDVVGQIDFGAHMPLGTWQPDAWAVSPFYETTTTANINLSGAIDAAPLSVYQSSLNQVSTETGLVWQIPAADGTYKLRLHFYDFNTQANQRVFDVLVNGALAADNYDIAVAAGGVGYKAVVLEINATVTGGSGINLRLNDVIGDANISGLEILRANPLAPGGTTTYQLDSQADAAAAWVRENGAGLSETDRLGFGQFTWTAGAQTAGNTARLRVVASTGVMGVSANPFLITNAGKEYYINDGVLTGDEFTTATGNDFNTGKSPDQPMATLAALLEAYNLDPEDVIYLDTGNHAVWRDIIWIAEDSGARVQGPLNGGVATLDRANASPATTVFRIDGADDVSITRVRLINAESGVRVYNDADGFRLTFSQVSGNRSYGVNIENSGSDNAYIADNTLFGIPGATTNDDQSYGIQINNSTNTNVLRNRLYDGSFVGIEVNGGSTYNVTLTGNVVSNFASHGIGFYTSGLVSGNTVYDNGGHGIIVGGAGTRTVTGNIVYNQLGAQSFGIYSTFGTNVTNNTVYRNTRGIYAYGNEITGNRVFGNVNSGIEAAVNEHISGNFIYSNATGIEVKSGSAGLVIDNNLIYSNTNYGILISNTAGSSAANGSRIVNNTIDQPVGDAVRITSGNTWITFVNNIITVGTGNGIYFAASTGNGFTAWKNLYYHPGGAGSFIGQRNGTSYGTLAAWQAATSLDAQSLFGDPLFIDKDGRDNLSGFAVATGDSGRDDNYYVSKNSPAIDSGDSWKGPVTDLFGQVRRDDPGTVNTGSLDYIATGLGSSGFTSTGSSMFLSSANSYTSFTLSTPFPFYGQNYTTVYVTTEGYLVLGTFNGNVAADNSLAALMAGPIIAPMWDNLTTAIAGGGVFRDSTVAGQTTVRWVAALQSDTTKTANFAVTLYNDGRIRFHYGAGNTGLTPTVGISSGTGLTSLASYDGAASLTNVNSLEVAATNAGIRDMGAIEFAGSGLDSTPPVVTASTPGAVFLSGSSNSALFHLGLTFSEALNPIDGLTPANFELRSSGVNGLFGDADDIITPLDPVYVAGGNGLVLRVLNGPLPTGNYRLTISGESMRDLAGNRLDGDSNGTPGGNFVRTFTITTEPISPRVTGVAVGRSTWSDSFRQTIDPGAGLGFRIGTGAAQNTVIPWANLDQISITFSEHVVVDLTQIQLRNSTGTLIPVEKASMNVVTHTLTLTLGQPLGSAHYELSLTDAVTDAWGNALDGEWQNGVSTQSGNGAPGGAFAFAFRVQEGDVNGDGATNDVDLFSVWQHISLQPYGVQWDLNGDGSVTNADITLISQNYLQSLPGTYTLSGGLKLPVPSPLIEIINNVQP
jgi:parallel beta-helix repeat protein